MPNEKNKQSLWDITEDCLALHDILTDVEGDVSDEVALQAVDEWFAENEANLAAKADGYAALIQLFTARGKARKAEAQRMARLAEADENNARRLKSRMLWALDRLGLRRLDTDRFRLTVAGNGGKVPVEVLGDVPDTYMIVSRRPDMDAIRQALESGKEVPGARLGERGQHLRVA